MTGTGETLLRVQVLGPVRVWRGAEELEIGSAQPRAVLAVLALAGGRAVSRADLIDAIWDSPTDKADTALFSHVSRLRAALEPGRRSRAPGQALVSVGSGYSLRIDPGQVDAGSFAKEVADARRARSAGDLAAAAALVEHALGLWQGTALAGIASMWADAERAALEEARQAAVEQLAEIKLEMGFHAEMTAELAGLVRRHPFRERLRSLYMLALYRSGRQADALAAFRDARQALDADQGIEPGAALRRLHEQMLAADPALDLRLPTPRRRGDAAASADFAADPGDETTVRFSLPPDAAAFTGRTSELDHITAAIAGASEAGGLVAIHAIGGMPGVGKTALAVHVAHALRSRFPDRQLFIDLHAHTPGREPVPADEALAGLLTTVGVDARYLPDGIEGRTGLWRDRMAGQRAVLVLDNVASSAQVAPLLPGTEHCLVLVTSRRHLGDLPGAVAHVMLDVLMADQARDMFLRLAPLASKGPPQAVTELAELAGFLPLAISLLARVYARHPSWTLADLVQETRASMLTLAAENISVAAAFEVSYRYLLPDQQQFLRRLGIHPGTTIDRYSAAALTGTDLPEATRYLDTLHREALLTEAGYRRYRMHDLIRRYASEHAATEPDADRSLALERLLDYYTAALATAQSRLARRTHNAPAPMPHAHPAALCQPTPAVRSPDGRPETAMPDLADTAAALAWARAERANLLACLEEAVKSGQHARVVALAAGLALLLQQDGPWTDAIALDLTAAEAARRLGDRLSQANALNDLGVVHRLTGQYPAAAEALNEALGIYRELGDRLGQANALNDLGVVHRMDGQYQVAAEVLDQALGVYRTLGDRLGEANAVHDLGALRLVTGEYAEAVTLLQAALAIYRDMHDLLGQADALNYLGDAQRMIGNYSDAAQALEAALRIYRQLGNRRGQANVLNWLGIVRRLTGDYQAAGAALDEALSIARDVGSRLGQANALGSLGIMRRVAGDYPGAADALDAALKLYRDLGDKGGEVEILNEAGTLHRLRGELDLAAAYHQEALDMARDIESSWDEAHALAGLGRCGLSAGDVVAARDLLVQSQRIFEHIGAAEAAGLAAELNDLA